MRRAICSARARLVVIARDATVTCDEVKEDEIAQQRRAVEQEVTPPPPPLAGRTSSPDLRLGRGRLIHVFRRLAPKLEKTSPTLVAPIGITLEETNSVVLPALTVSAVGVIGIALRAGHNSNGAGLVIQKP